MPKPKLSDLQRLRQMLLWKYDPYVRPVLDESQFTVVTIELDVHHISMVSHIISFLEFQT